NLLILTNKLSSFTMSSKLTTYHWFLKMFCTFQFSFNLLSITKLIQFLSCKISFFHDHCLIEDLGSLMMIGKTKAINGLYLVKDKFEIWLHLTNFVNLVETQFHIKIKSPISVLYNKLPNLPHLQVFGSQCYTCTLVANKKKFHSHARKCLFLGYEGGVKRLLLFDLHNRELFLSKKVVFHETNFLSPKSTFFYITTQLSIICLPSNTTSPNLDHPNISKSETSTKLFKRLPLQYNSFTPYNIITYLFSYFLTFDHLSLSYKSFALFVSNMCEPKTYKQVSKLECWQKATNQEISVLE
ncbi:hypothetical protein CR513_45209, partial [Mucuna pruriens]